MPPQLPHPSVDVSPAQAAAWHADGRVTLVDVREPAEHAAGHVEGDVHVALGELAQAASRLPADRPVVFYCRVGGRSRAAADAFREAGIDAHSMSGGLLGWAAEGLPLSPDGGRVAEH